MTFSFSTQEQRSRPYAMLASGARFELPMAIRDGYPDQHLKEYNSVNG